MKGVLGKKPRLSEQQPEGILLMCFTRHLSFDVKLSGMLIYSVLFGVNDG